ncbi:Hypothetical protein CINCED_3A005232 [Cinara cedri]|uniref:Uncharacterized protein n=1 Tax=Cinara cedri TaxID=506608 RepID=A0A5E4MH06_9HEMI|nr:Hypothetical protein CINCED_3A005232 [Cinara cedri]
MDYKTGSSRTSTLVLSLAFPKPLKLRMSEQRVRWAVCSFDGGTEEAEGEVELEQGLRSSDPSYNTTDTCRQFGKKLPRRIELYALK